MYILILTFLLFSHNLINEPLRFLGLISNNDIEVKTNDLPDSIKENIFKSEDKKLVFEDYLQKVNDNEKNLLILVNKSNSLNDKFIPDDLTNITKLFPTNKSDIYLRQIILEDLTYMITDAKKDKSYLSIVSAYRSYKTQSIVYNGWKAKYGENEANRISAKPGHSQHQLGTAIDFNSLEESFESTKEGKWLLENSWKYGFILSYPKGQENITGYKYEPWHYRYVGKNTAYIIYQYFNNSMEVFLNWYWKNYQ